MIWISSFVKYLFKFSAHFFIGYLSLIIMRTSSLSVTCRIIILTVKRYTINNHTGTVLNKIGYITTQLSVVLTNFIEK